MKSSLKNVTQSLFFFSIAPTRASRAAIKTVTVKKASAVSQAINSLTKGKTYYVRIRSYKTVSGKNVYFDWSAPRA